MKRAVFTSLLVAATALSGVGTSFAQQDDVFRLPDRGTTTSPAPPPPPADNQTGTEPPADDNGAVPLPDDNADYRSVPVPNRSAITSMLGIKDDPLNPFQQSTLKGDRPIFGTDYFLKLDAIVESVFDIQSTPIPVDTVVSNSPGSNNNFGKPRQNAFIQMVIPTFDFFKGDTAFKPPDFEFELTPALVYNHLNVDELGVVNANPLKGTERDSVFVGIQEAFIDYRYREVSDRFDFDTVKIGIQPINVDFRGFLFNDEALGIRFLGDRDNNRYQYNLAYFRRIEKDTDSGLNDLGQDLRRDDVYLADLFVQDLPVQGFTSEFSVIHNTNHDTGIFFDSNDFLTRPAALGLENSRHYNATYIGFNGDGHFGRINLTNSFYYLLGNDSLNELSGQKANIRAYFAAAEPSYDLDFMRIRGSLLYSSGDKDPTGRTEGGFDSILENPQFAGADTSYFIRQSIPFIGGGGVNLTQGNALIPDLRSSKDEGQSNFLNPGLVLEGIGDDIDILPELRLTFNANHFSFADTNVLSTLRLEGHIHRDIGEDLSAALTYRPFETQNVVLRTSAAFLLPGQGFKDLFPSTDNDKKYYSVLFDFLVAY
jgi:hypothetical protein